MQEEQHGKRPNVVFLIADDHRGEALGAFGNTIVQTPILDGLANSGVSFKHTHIFGGLNGAVCAPSRACVNTGKSIFHTLTGEDLSKCDQTFDIRPDVKLMPQTMREAGYCTHAIGKWHNDKPSFARSFEGGDKLFFYGMSSHTKVPVQDFDPTGAYPKEREYIEEMFSTELFTDAAVQFVESYDDERPFYLYVAYTAPHDPRTAPEPYAAMYQRDQIPLPPNFMKEHPFDNGEMSVRDENFASLPRDADEVRQHIADYYAMITHMDAEIGRIVEALQAKGIYENTLIVYTADHGLSIGQHGLMGKQNLYEHSIRIPLIMSGPGLPQGKPIEELSSNIDIFPTVAAICDVELSEKTDGVSLLPLAAGECDTVRDVVCSVYKDIQRMATDGQWKLIRYYRSPISDTGTDCVQLFNLRDDPWETTDLSSRADCAEPMEWLTAALENWMREMSDFLG
ncbi:sulfatase-like hydrolase/transferase [Paenibacillus alba]|uniref:sulfatase-like hydrolase/transferase n=1 Tax=Paenibacillus alba TaxID=1197127 RepID=UPI00156750E7|nr:sulfatase-like hydrolase/transferase [Paenibacillus alba]NQX66998.1 sulfatase-like hydrolase/transferase [Paenibacillus alba]